MEEPMFTSVQPVQKSHEVRPHWNGLSVPSPIFLSPHHLTWPGHQLLFPGPQPILVPAAHTASDSGPAPGQTAAPRPGPSGGSPFPEARDTQQLSQSTGAPVSQPASQPFLHPSPHSQPYLPKHLLLGTPPCAPCQVTVFVGHLKPGQASSHSGIQQAAPGTKHYPASPQRKPVLGGEHSKASEHPHPNIRETSAFPSPQRLGAHQSISPLA